MNPTPTCPPGLIEYVCEVEGVDLVCHLEYIDIARWDFTMTEQEGKQLFLRRSLHVGCKKDANTFDRDE
jgi:hypothetical protein